MIVVSIIYPADPLGIVPGGIDTFIRGILKYSPDDIVMRMVGVTTGPAARPVGRWTTCALDGRTFEMFPVLALNSAGTRGCIPLSMRFTAAVAGYRKMVEGDVLEFHRLEPAVLFANDKRAKNAFIHQNMQELKNRKSDILWSRLPGLYYRLEDWLMPKLNSVYIVREDAVKWYQGRFPSIASNFRFTPTWVDPDVFRLPTESERKKARDDLSKEFSFDSSAQILLSVGRLDSQKDPLLLAEAFVGLRERYPQACLIYVGDGVLRGQVEAYAKSSIASKSIYFAGLRSAQAIAQMFWAADLFVLSSAYEGMPMCVLEALGSGVPVVTTDVGEIRRVVLPGKNGAIVNERTADALADAMTETLMAGSRFYGAPCLEAVAAFTPAQVLEPIYENYRFIAAQGRIDGRAS